MTFQVVIAEPIPAGQAGSLSSAPHTISCFIEPCGSKPGGAILGETGVLALKREWVLLTAQVEILRMTRA